MTRLIVPAALALAALVPAAQAQTSPETGMTAQQTTALRCSVAFALVAEGQAKDDPAVAEYPALGERGREFFVRSSAQIMDQTGMSREQVAVLLEGEIDELRAPGQLEAVMPPCLLLLEASGL